MFEITSNYAMTTILLLEHNRDLYSNYALNVPKAPQKRKNSLSGLRPSWLQPAPVWT